LSTETTTSSIDLNKEGKYTGTIKIVAVEKQERIWWVQIEGSKKKLKAFPKQAARFAKAVEDGAEGEAEIEVAAEEYPKDSGQMTYPAYLRSFGGPNQAGGGRGGYGRGGGSSYTPKEFYAELAPSIGGIYNHGIDKGLPLDQIEAHAKSYGKIMATLKAKGHEAHANGQRGSEDGHGAR
jgi:hypothetical protein